jgi:hypothetical protein
MTARTCEWHDEPTPCKACRDKNPFNHKDRATPDLAATRTQPEPVKTDSVPVVHYVIKDILARADVGLDRYGTMLKADNGRDHLVDAYQEALDLACYLRAELIRRDGK